jgi:two-component system, NarL family, response regulator NreC
VRRPADQSYHGQEQIISTEPASLGSLMPAAQQRSAAPAADNAVPAPRPHAHIRILVVDEPGIMRDGLCALLADTGEFHIVGTQADAGEALRALSGARPDVMIIDLSGLQAIGHEAIAEAKTRQPAVRVLVLTFRKDDTLIETALRAGADGYVLKNDSRNDLFMALRSIASGRGYISPTITNRVVSGYVRASDPARARTTQRSELSERERQIIRLIAAGRRTREMAEMLSLSPKTVEKHRANLMRKLGLRNASAVAAYAIANGYVDV